MIWLLAISLLLNIATLVVVYLFYRAILDKLLEMREAINRIPVTDFPPVPECRFKESESKCLYSPGSEPERICVLREEDKKNRDQKIPQVIPAPRWIERSPPHEG